MATRKLSGAELAKQLSGLASPGGVAPAEPAETPGGLVEAETPSPPEPDPPRIVAEAPARATQAIRGRSASSSRPRGGRPAKAGVDGMPVNVRLSQADHLALARLAGKLVVPGRPMPTVQDVVRGIIRGALKEPELATRFCRQQDS
jgi:hypothetical protein